FWSTAMAKTINAEAHIHARVYGKDIVITESSVRRDLQLADKEAMVESSRDEESLVNDAQVSTAATVTITTKEISLAEALEALKTSKAKVKRIVFQEPSKSTTTTTIISLQHSQDKGKGIMIEEHLKPKKKDQIRLDEKAALKLQAEFDEEERLAREKAE
nr:hypothetical protein [Tanacetum cinerariifolium]